MVGRGLDNVIQGEFPEVKIYNEDIGETEIHPEKNKKPTKIQYDSKHADTYNVFHPTTMIERCIE